MSEQNKLKCLFVASIYQSSLFAIKAACITLCVAPGLTHKYDTSLNQIVRAEHTSLLYLFIWDEVKGFWRWRQTNDKSKPTTVINQDNKAFIL